MKRLQRIHGFAYPQKFDWFTGTDLSTAVADIVDGNINAAAGETIQDLAAGNYTVLITNLTTGCTNQQTLYLDELIELPVFS